MPLNSELASDLPSISTIIHTAISTLHNRRDLTFNASIIDRVITHYENNGEALYMVHNLGIDEEYHKKLDNADYKDLNINLLWEVLTVFSDQYRLCLASRSYADELMKSTAKQISKVINALPRHQRYPEVNVDWTQDSIQCDLAIKVEQAVATIKASVHRDTIGKAMGLKGYNRSTRPRAFRKRNTQVAEASQLKESILNYPDLKGVIDGVSFWLKDNKYVIKNMRLSLQEFRGVSETLNDERIALEQELKQITQLLNVDSDNGEDSWST